MKKILIIMGLLISVIGNSQIPITTSTGVPALVTSTNIPLIGITPPDIQTAGIANLQLWVKASQGVTFSTGLAVAQWNDLSGHSRNLTQATGANQPTLVYNYHNGYPSIYFAANTAMSLPSALSYSQETIIAIGTFINASTYNMYILATSSTIVLGRTTSPSIYYRPNGVAITYGLGVTCNELIGTFNNYNSLVAYDNLQHPTTGVLGGSLTYISGIGYINSSVTPFYIDELMIFDKALPLSIIQALNNYYISPIYKIY